MSTTTTDPVMRIVLKEPSPLFIARLMDVTGMPFEDLFEIARD